MTDYERIEELKAEIKAKREEIKRLRGDGTLTVGNARITQRQRIYAKSPIEWALCYRVPLQHTGGRKQLDQYKALGVYGTREEAIAAIPGVVEDLKALYAAAHAEEKA